jgi:hypothetical protein
MPVREKGRKSPVRSLHVLSHVPSHAQNAAKVRGFSPSDSGFTAETDWLLEEAGFEPSVPPDRSNGGTSPADVRFDAPTLFSSGARRRLRATRIHRRPLPDPPTWFANSRYFRRAFYGIAKMPK